MHDVSLLQTKKAGSNPALAGTAAAVLVLSFALLVILSDQIWLRWMGQLFQNADPNLWGLVSRGHMLLLGILVLILGRNPRLFGFQIGKTFQSWKILLLVLTLNCGIVGGYLILSGPSPYSGNEWLLTEAVWVPLIEELVWRGVVFTLLFTGLQKYYAEHTSRTLAIWISGVVFGMLHANNLFYGVPPTFVAVQVLNAVVWGVVYCYLRARTESIYPPIFLHAAMNLVVVLY